jgi:hypothetical protein
MKQKLLGIPQREYSAGRKLQRLDETIHDPYQSKAKLREPTACPDCDAVYRNGRWVWGLGSGHNRLVRCPACQRIHDKFPAGYVTIEGEYATAHRDELLNIARHIEAKEKAEHPLQRIMDVENVGDQIIITTTDIHLARGIGDALHHAHQGELNYHYEPGQYFLRVSWER